jgi:hypothetical protein
MTGWMTGIFFPPARAQRNGADFALPFASMSAIIILIIAGLAVILAIGLAYVPLRLLVEHIARNVRDLIQRQRERRAVDRVTPDRRKVLPPNP